MCVRVSVCVSICSRCVCVCGSIKFLGLVVFFFLDMKLRVKLGDQVLWPPWQNILLSRIRNKTWYLRFLFFVCFTYLKWLNKRLNLITTICLWQEIFFFSFWFFYWRIDDCAVTVSGWQSRDSAIHLHVSILSQILLSSRLHITLYRVPCDTE